jgi:xylulokinase
MKRYILAHDLGTSGNKATLYHTDGRMAASCVREYPAYYPASGWVEQDPEDWWKAVCSSTRELIEKSGISAGEIEAVSFSAQMMGCLPVDVQGKPLRPMIIWADTRAGKEEAFMKERIGMERGYEITGHRLSASYSAAKLLWIRNHEPQVYHKCRWMLQAKDYIIFRLTGNIVTDYSDASGTNLFDIRKKCWSEEIISALDIDPSILPEPHPSTDIGGRVTREAAELTGLLEGTPVVIGGGDGSCACAGAGVVEEGSAYHVLGSSSWISMASKSPYFDPELRTFNWVHLDPELYTPCGTMQAAGYSYNWYKRTLCQMETMEAEEAGISPYERINEGVKKAEPGAGGVIYLPYILGERSPRWDADVRGAFLGMSVTTTKEDLSRAVLEGVSYNLRIILESLKQGRAINDLRVIGGGAKGEAWLQILADIYQMPLKVPVYLEEATSLGAAVCAGVGVGIYPDFSAVKRINPVVREILPQKSLAGRYDKLYTIFNQAYEGLKEVNQGLGEYRMEMEREKGADR